MTRYAVSFHNCRLILRTPYPSYTTLYRVVLEQLCFVSAQLVGQLHKKMMTNRVDQSLSTKVQFQLQWFIKKRHNVPATSMRTSSPPGC